MEKQILFRDYQEQQAQDHKDLQDFARASIDHLVYDAVTKSRRFSGFNTIKTAQTELQIQPGRFYANDGAIYNRSTTLVQSVLSYLPAAARRGISMGSDLSDLARGDFGPRPWIRRCASLCW